MATKQVGDRVGPYVLTQVLGAGGAGQVFRATWQPDDDQRAESPEHPGEVAIKLMLPSHAANENVFRRFVREIGVAQNIHHPHLVRHLDSGLADDVLYYAMELVGYGSLREVIHRRGSLPWRDVVESARQIAAALGALHDAGVIHRDLKPENVFLSESGGLKLGDFGLAYKQEGSDLTVGGQTVGSVRYMAPEQVCGKRDLDGRCDLYALGCLMFEMLAGRPPFTESEPMAVFAQHVEEPPPRLRSLVPGLPATLESLVDRLLEKDKDDRPPSAHTLEAALDALLASDSGEIETLEELLEGDATPIEPLPLDEQDDSLSGSTGNMSGSLSSSFAAAEPAEDDDDDSSLGMQPRQAGAPAPPVSDLSRRLVDGGEQRPQESAGKAMLALAVVIVVVIIAAIVMTR